MLDTSGMESSAGTGDICHQQLGLAEELGSPVLTPQFFVFSHLPQHRATGQNAVPTPPPGFAPLLHST